jgi:hypothetical protein
MLELGNREEELIEVEVEEADAETRGSVRLKIG